jgi:hypothetical protein
MANGANQHFHASIHCWPACKKDIDDPPIAANIFIIISLSWLWCQGTSTIIYNPTSQYVVVSPMLPHISEPRTPTKKWLLRVISCTRHFTFRSWFPPDFPPALVHNVTISLFIYQQQQQQLHKLAICSLAHPKCALDKTSSSICILWLQVGAVFNVLGSK